MPTATRLTLAAAAGLLALTACSGPDAGTAPRSTTSAPPSASTSASPDLAQAPLGTEEHEVRELTVAGRPVDVPAGATLSLSPDRPAFQAVLQGVCGQPRWGVSVQAPDLWSATGQVPQPAEGCAPEAPGQDARAALDRLFTGEVHARTDNGTLTLTRDGVALVLAPAA